MNHYFTSWHAFVNMGGYADYVWPAYFLALFLLLINGIKAARQLRKLRKKIID